MSSAFVATVANFSRVIEGLLRLIVLDFLSWWLEIH